MKVEKQLDQIQEKISSVLQTPLTIYIENHAQKVTSRSQSRITLAKLMGVYQQKDFILAEKMEMPNKRYSLSHCLQTVVAVASQAAGSRGVGVDLEFGRTLKPEAAKLFLTKTEQTTLKALFMFDKQNVLRLWTIKEAVFKADLDNAENFWLFEYETMNPRLWTGVAIKKGNSGTKHYHYASTIFRDGFLTVAIAI